MAATTRTEQKISQNPGGDGEVVGALRARQGFKDRPILYVLLASLALVVIAFGVAFMTNNKEPVNPGYEQTTNPAEAATFNAPAPAPKVVESN